MQRSFPSQRDWANPRNRDEMQNQFQPMPYAQPTSWYLIILNSNSSDRNYDLGTILEPMGDNCHQLENVWVVHTNIGADNLYRRLIDVVDPNDKFMLAPLAGPWIPYNCDSMDDCHR